MVTSDESSRSAHVRPNPHLYEINTWSWLESLSSKLGRFVHIGEVPNAEWDGLAQKGFDFIWLMGIWQRSDMARRIALEHKYAFPAYDRALPGWKPSDIVGSPYSVAGYVPDPRIGTWETLDFVREKLRVRGMKLFFDFVGNHTALDHPWTREHPEFYVQGSRQDFERDPGSFFHVKTFEGDAYLALGKDPYFAPWTDTAQLNHFQPQMRAAQLADLHTIASHCDGVRCDMAMLHLNDIFGRVWSHLLGGLSPPAREFWTDVHNALPNFVLLAEAYWGTEGRLLELGFSYAYDKGLYDIVRDIRLPDVHRALGADVGYQDKMARFLENHDEPRCAVAFGTQRLPSVGTLMGTLPGMRLYHQGELEGRSIQTPITLRITAPEKPDPIVLDFFKKILQSTNRDIFHLGQWRLLSVNGDGRSTGDNLIAYEWRLGNEWKVIVVNLGGDAGQGRVVLGDSVLPGKSYIFHDDLDERRYERDGDELLNLGLFVYREAYQAHLFDVTPIE